MATLKRIEKIVQENPFDEKKKRPGLKFNPGSALIGLQTTGPCILSFAIILVFHVVLTIQVCLCSISSLTPQGGGTLGISGWGCATGTLEPLAYTRAEFCYLILD